MNTSARIHWPTVTDNCSATPIPGRFASNDPCVDNARGTGLHLHVGLQLITTVRHLQWDGAYTATNWR